MKLFAIARQFKNDESGAVTVDWVVLTAAIVGLGIAVVATVRGGVNDMGTTIDTSLSSATVVTPTNLGFTN
jgi:Flp pilus assembly pilin Flp